MKSFNVYVGFPFFLEPLKYWTGVQLCSSVQYPLTIFLSAPSFGRITYRTTGTMTIEVSCRCIKADERNQSIFTKDSELDVVDLFSKRFIEITC